MQNRWLKWQPDHTTNSSVLRKVELTKLTVTDQTKTHMGSVSFGSGLPQGKSITHISSSVVGKVSKRDRREATERYLSERHEPIVLPPMCTCLAKPYPHDAHRNEEALFKKHLNMRLR